MIEVNKITGRSLFLIPSTKKHITNTVIKTKTIDNVIIVIIYIISPNI